MNTDRVKGLVIPEAELIEIIQRHCNDSDLPDGCQAVAAIYDFERRAFIIKLFHDSFPVQKPFVEMERITIQGETVK